LHGVTGHVFVIMVMTIAAAEAAVGLAIVISVFRQFGTVEMSALRTLRG
jgi:NADH-quinone oxidoreductase subunit K